MDNLNQTTADGFAGEFFSWCTSMLSGAADITLRSDSWPFVICIGSPSKKPLEIALVSLRCWVEEEQASELLRLYYSRQRERRSEGNNVIVLWEDVWLTKKEIVKSRIASLLGLSSTLPGRLTGVRRIDKAQARKFLDENHLQGDTASKYRLGLFLPRRYFRVLPAHLEQRLLTDSELLVAVATFSAPRIFQKDRQPHRSYEMIRFANILGATVVGGFDKLIKHFVEEIKPDDIMTYADSEWSDGSSYQSLGFAFVSEKPSMELWLDPRTLQRTSGKNVAQTTGLMKIINAGSRKFVRDITANQSRKSDK